MPYEVKRDPEACSEDKPWSVRNTETGDVEGCHATEDDAKKHMAALQANVSDAPRTVPEQRTIDVDVKDIDTRGRTLHGYAAVYNVESEDLGGFRERIAPGAFSGVLSADVRALLNHDPSQVLGRTKSGTLRLRDEQRGLKFEVDLPDSPLGANVREAVRRGDIDGASFRFVVGEDEWQDDLRTVKSVKDLKDVTVATFGAYPAASVELRTRNHNVTQKENEAVSDETKNEERGEASPAGSLRVEERAEVAPFQSLTEAFRTRGFPGDVASVSWDEFRAVTWGGTINALNHEEVAGVPLGADQRYLWSAVPSVAVNAGVTSVDVFQQTARSLPAGTAVVRNIDAVTAKPEVGSTLNITTVPLKQVAAIETNIPNVYLERDELATVVETDLRLAVNEGFDRLVLDGLAASGFQAPGTDNILVSIRKAMTTLQGSGYNPDTLVLTPANSEAIDTMVSGISGGTADFVFGPGRFAPGTLFGLKVAVSKSTPAAVVLDSKANGKLYVSPISLARFEVDAGSTNRSNVRLEGHGAYGVERTAAAVRIAAS
jgi:Escherichia/Staphylococcus phage prohead protease